MPQELLVVGHEDVCTAPRCRRSDQIVLKVAVQLTIRAGEPHVGKVDGNRRGDVLHVLNTCPRDTFGTDGVFLPQ